MPHSPLLQSVVDLLNAHPDGLNELQIRQGVLKQSGFRSRPAEIADLLKRDSVHFFGPLAEGLLVRLRDRVRDGEGQRLIAVGLQKRNLLETLARDFGRQLARFAEFHQTKVDPQYGATLALEADPQKSKPTSWQPVRTAQSRLRRELQETGSLLHGLIDWLIQHPLASHQVETINELRYLRDKFYEEAKLLDEILRVGFDRLVKVHWIEVEQALPSQPDPLSGQPQPYTGPYRWAVKRAPVRVGPTLEAELYQGKRTVVFTSTTLRTTRESGFGFILERLGLTARCLPGYCRSHARRAH
jgi:Rad3-related DNA helicase